MERGPRDTGDGQFRCRKGVGKEEEEEEGPEGGRDSVSEGRGKEQG